MARLPINTGSALDDPSAESIVSAFTKTNAMTLELFTALSLGGREVLDLDASPDTIRAAFVKTNTNLAALYTEQSLPSVPVIDVGDALDDPVPTAETIYAAFTKVNTAMTAVYGSLETPEVADYYVATTGNNSNAGTIGSPFQTITKGVSMLSAGTTLLIRGGTYAESLINNIPSGTSWANKVRIAAYPGEAVWMKPTSGANVIHLQGTSQYIEFDGINLDADGVISNAVKFESFIGAASHNPHHIRMQNAEILGPSSTADTSQSRVGILVTNLNNISTGFCEFINLRIHRMRNKYVGTSTANQGSLCMYLQQPNTLVDGCELYDFRYAALQIYSAYGHPAQNVIIRNCNIHDPTRVSGQGHSGLAIYSTTSGTKIYNNIIHDIQSDGSYVRGIDYGSGAQGVALSFNTIYNTGTGIVLPGHGSTHTVRNNLVYGCATPSTLVSGTVASNNLNLPSGSTNPLFVNASTDNYHLQAGSPAVGAGVAVSGITTDRDGVTRGTPPDIGAYEYVP